MLPELSVTAWLFLSVGAAVVGFAKTAISGAGALAVVAFAAALPARESTGAVLPLLIAGDLVALSRYGRHASWPTLRRLLPGVLPGLLLGAWFLSEASDDFMRRFLGSALLVLTLWQLIQRWRTGGGSAVQHPHRVLTVVVGVLAGFTTMTANAAGPVMTLYLLLAGLPKLQWLGTTAWFFLLVNISKLPLSASLDLISVQSLALDTALLPLMLVGAAAGALLVRRIRQLTFERAALGLSAVASLLLLL